jgi:hypothetical protein
VTFFAYPNKPTTPVPPGVDIHVLARTDQDADEAVTFGRGFFPFACAAEPHDWLNSTGGAIGCGWTWAAPISIGPSSPPARASRPRAQTPGSRRVGRVIGHRDGGPPGYKGLGQHARRNNLCRVEAILPRRCIRKIGHRLDNALYRTPFADGVGADLRRTDAPADDLPRLLRGRFAGTAADQRGADAVDNHPGACSRLYSGNRAVDPVTMTTLPTNMPATAVPLAAFSASRLTAACTSRNFSSE